MTPLADFLLRLIDALAGDRRLEPIVMVEEIGLDVPVDLRYASRSLLLGDLPITRLDVGIARPLGRLRLAAEIVRA